MHTFVRERDLNNFTQKHLRILAQTRLEAEHHIRAWLDHAEIYELPPEHNDILSILLALWCAFVNKNLSNPTHTDFLHLLNERSAKLPEDDRHRLCKEIAKMKSKGNKKKKESQEHVPVSPIGRNGELRRMTFKAALDRINNRQCTPPPSVEDVLPSHPAPSDHPDPASTAIMARESPERMRQNIQDGKVTASFLANFKPGHENDFVRPGREFLANKEDLSVSMPYSSVVVNLLKHRPAVIVTEPSSVANLLGPACPFDDATEAEVIQRPLTKASKPTRVADVRQACETVHKHPQNQLITCNVAARTFALLLAGSDSEEITTTITIRIETLNQSFLSSTGDVHRRWPRGAPPLTHAKVMMIQKCAPVRSTGLDIQCLAVRAGQAVILVFEESSESNAMFASFIRTKQNSSGAITFLRSTQHLVPTPTDLHRHSVPFLSYTVSCGSALLVRANLYYVIYNDTTEPLEIVSTNCRPVESLKLGALDGALTMLNQFVNALKWLRKKLKKKKFKTKTISTETFAAFVHTHFNGYTLQELEDLIKRQSADIAEYSADQSARARNFHLLYELRVLLRCTDLLVKVTELTNWHGLAENELAELRVSQHHQP